MSWEPCQDVIWIDDGDEIRLYDAQSNEFKSLNETGAKIWRLLINGNTPAAITDHLARSYGAEAEHEWALVQGDVQSFIGELVDGGLIVWTDADADYTADSAVSQSR